ncbi:MAG: hypothetical protein CL677_01480 [Bdellovibrionaceae bacterium]|nr:hypothetical protein [Pseudobdellovibrionaceae bacterium]|tara:strand:+ start:38953 stop:39657 length:705 start_codon:yes stop_codon:yes gene_type:complete
MPLKQVIEDIEKQSDQVLCVFDLDSTLFNVSPRTQHILRMYPDQSPEAKTFGASSEMLREVIVEPQDWGIKQALSRHQVTGTIDFFESVREFWMKHFFSGEFLHIDEPYEGAIDYVNELHKRGAKIIYLTGRDQHRMGESTKKSLLSNNFPLDEDHLLMLKPTTAIRDSVFKAEVFAQLEKDHSTIWFFENEPVNINVVQNLFPQVKMIYMDSTHSGREAVSEDTPTIELKFDF